MNMQHERAFDNSVERMTCRFLTAWELTPTSIPDDGRTFSPRQQRQNEKQASARLESFPGSMGDIEAMPEEERMKLRLRMKSIFLKMPLFGTGAVSEGFLESAETSTWEFIRGARAFDPAIAECDIRQALRNLWVFNSIQAMLGRQTKLTPSGLAYSLLYPYTDNGLDGSGRTAAEKEAMLRWLTCWFKGTECPEPDGLTAKVAALVRMIEKEFPRGEFPDVCNSLHAIHRAQRRSMLLHHPAPGTPERDLLAITIEKGGTSVLADGYLAAGTMDAKTADAVYGFGVLLQLLDDVRDVGEDEAAGHSTPFTRAHAQAELEAMTGRLLRFTGMCAGLLKRHSRAPELPIDRMVNESVSFVIGEAVACAPHLYSHRFLQAMERRLPLRMEYLREMKQRVKAKRPRISDSACVGA